MRESERKKERNIYRKTTNIWATAYTVNRKGRSADGRSEICVSILIELMNMCIHIIV